MRAVRLLAPLAALAALALTLTVTGCSDSSEPRPTPTPTPTPTSTEAAGKSKAGDAGGTGDAGDVEACLAGEWGLDGATASRLTATLLESMGADVDVTITGEAVLRFDDGVATWTYTDYTTALVIRDDGAEVETVTVQNGPATQPYTLEGDMMTSAALDLSATTMDITTSIDGVTRRLTDDEVSQSMASASLSGQGQTRLSCTDTELAMTPVVLGAEQTDLATVLTRR